MNEKREKIKKDLFRTIRGKQSDGKNAGITLIALVVTIVILIIIAGISINMILGNNGLFNKTNQAKEEHQKQTATEIMNLKITNIQISSYTENQQLPNLQYVSDKLCEDKDMEYVILKEKEQASLEKITVGSADSILTKLKEYPYVFEINNQLQLASIDGVKVASNDTTEYVSKTQYDSLLARVVALEGINNNNSIGTIYNSTEVTTTWNKTTWTKLRTITLEPGTYIIELNFIIANADGSGNTFIGLGSGENGTDNVNSNGTYAVNQWIRNSSSYTVTPTETTTYNMTLWTDHRSSSEIQGIRKIEMRAIKIK